MNDVVKEVVGALEEKAEQLQEGLNAKFQDFEQKQLTSIRGTHYSGTSSPGAQATKSERLSHMKDGHHSTGRIHMDGTDIKALTSEQGSTDSPQSGISVLPNEIGGLFGVGRRPVRLLDVIGRQAVGSNAVQYTRLNNFSNAAAAQAGEGATKAEQSFDPQLISVDISTIAVIAKLSRQVLEDTNWLSASIDALFRYQLADRLEAQLIAGDGSNFSISGLMSEGSSASGSSGTAAVDQIGAELADMAADGYEPGYILVNPSDWQTWRSERNTDDLYVAGSWAQPAPPMIWNVPAIASPSVTAGKAVLVHSPSAVMFDRQAPSVELFEQDSDNVQKNLVTVRAELRAALGVMDDQGVRVLDIV